MASKSKSDKSSDSLDIPSLKDQVPSLSAQLATDSANRKELAPPSSLGKHRAALRTAIEEFRAQAERFGDLAAPGTLTERGLNLLVKKAIKRLIQRHLDQQRELNMSLLKVLDELTHYLEQQNRDSKPPAP